MKFSKFSYLILIVIAATIFSCSDDNSPGGSNNGGGTSGIVITTTSATSITNTSAVSGGNITSDGGSAIVEHGVCWSTTANPTIANTHTSDGNSVGVFTSNITGLIAGTLYYVRAYATNANTTGYGNQITITASGGGSGSGGCAGGPTTVTDIDGNVYNVVSIGNQCWMKENLKTTRYKNGVSIPTGLSEVQWQTTTNGAFAIYNDSAKYDSIYGKLYNWYAVEDPNGLCPTGWHEPEDWEWNVLIKTIDPNADTSCFPCNQSQLAGWDMKEIGLAHWVSPNTAANNISGFTGLPGGMRRSGQVIYEDIGQSGYWWSTSTISSTGGAYARGLNYYSGYVYYSSPLKYFAFSVRCVRD
jgi:uncharacterized protein (TIGR02145 family)